MEPGETGDLLELGLGQGTGSGEVIILKAGLALDVNGSKNAPLLGKRNFPPWWLSDLGCRLLPGA